MALLAWAAFCLFVRCSLQTSQDSLFPFSRAQLNLEQVPVFHEIPQYECNGEVFGTLKTCEKACILKDVPKNCEILHPSQGSRSVKGQRVDYGHFRPRHRSRRSRGSMFMWRREWSSCSVSCGVGEKRREGVCIHPDTHQRVREDRCLGKHKPPVTVRPCVQPPCPHAWRTDSKSSLLSQWRREDSFKAHFGDVFSDQIPMLPSFYPGEWSDCSVTCGDGTRSREVTCKSFNSFTKEEETFPDWECFGRKPVTVDSCEAGPCRGDLPSSQNALANDDAKYRWHVGEFSECSRSCKGGSHESQLRCVLEGPAEEEVSPALCSDLKKPAVIVRTCNNFACPPRWVTGDYGPCSQECGGGVMRRSVRCVQEEVDDTLMSVEDFRCPDPVPVAEAACSNVFCPAKWASDSWGECSESCGVGTQTRRVYCVKEPVAGHRVTVSGMDCLGPRPVSTRQCSLQDCPQDVAAPPVIKAENYTFIQLRRARKVKLNVGGTIVLLPGQAVTVRCPVKNYHRRLIFWSKQYKLVPMVGRVRATFNGNLKIRKANPVTDAGTYTCMAGAQSADVVVKFLSRKDALQKIKDVQHYFKDQSSRSSIVIKPGEPRYQDGVFQDGGHNLTKKFIYMADDWSPCSVTCGSGHQRRIVTCTRVSKKYIKILPKRECDRLGLEMPMDMRKCSPRTECPHWNPGNWTFCSLETCVRDGYAERRRELQCVYTNGSLAPNHLCSWRRRPETVRQCVNIDCISHWTTSKWTACRPSCGKQGSKIRMLICSWKKTGLPAWSACRIHARPLVKKVCKPRPCPSVKAKVCEDNSRYCSLVRKLRMCRYKDFHRKCCKSCTAFLQSTLS